MAQRDQEKSKRTPARAVAQRDAMANLEDRLLNVERERDRLLHELDSMRMRVAALEESRRQASSRIDWIIDSLHSLIDKDA
jgi:chromosome segregation ATPase